MRLCIPTATSEGKSAQVYGHFGSAPYFTVYDSQQDMIEVLPNMNHIHQHEACQPLGALQGKQIDAVICGGMGMRALQMLQAQGIKAYFASPGTVDQTISRYLGRQLPEITLDNACAGHGHGQGCH